MTIKCKQGAPKDIKVIDVDVHQRCVILHINGKNTLYEFNEGNRLLDDLSIYITQDDIQRVKNFLIPNSPMKFSSNTPIGNQLSLF